MSERGERRSRIAVLPRELASEVVTDAVARAGWAVSILVVLLDIPVVLDTFAEGGIVDQAVLPIACLVALAVVILLTGLRRTVATRIIHLVLGVALAVGFMVLVLRADRDLVGDGTILLNRPAFALVLLMPGTPRSIAGIAWSTIGLGLSIGSIALASLIVDVPFGPGWGPFTAWAVYSTAFLVVTIVRATQASRIPDLVRLEDETRRGAIEYQFEQRAAAMIHDTVLSDLTAVMRAPDELDERARERFRADVRTLRHPSWLREPGHELEVDPTDSEVRNGAVALVSEMQWRGLSVEVTGTNDAVVRISAEARSAIHAALRASFENVLAHSGAAAAELVVGGGAHELSYMVIDQGAGFDVASVRGLPDSIVELIEGVGGAVRVWSRPGAGTSVLLTVPADGGR